LATLLTFINVFVEPGKFLDIEDKLVDVNLVEGFAFLEVFTKFFDALFDLLILLFDLFEGLFGVGELLLFETA